MRQLGLQLLKALARALPFADVPDETGEQPAAAAVDLADRQLNGKRAAVLAAACHHATNTDDAPFARPEIALNVLVVAFSSGEGISRLTLLPQTSFAA